MSNKKKFTSIEFSRVAGFSNRELACVKAMTSISSKKTLNQWATFCVDQNIVDEQRVAQFFSIKKQSQ